MATLYEYFVKESAGHLCLDNTTTLMDRATNEPLLEIRSKLHLDFEANAKFVSFYIPATDRVDAEQLVGR
jgi:hypothetical protein